MKAYEELFTRRIILEEDAYDYALKTTFEDMELYNDFANWLVKEELIPMKTKEFVLSWIETTDATKQDFVEWFYSGNYIRVNLDEDGRVIDNVR